MGDSCHEISTKRILIVLKRWQLSSVLFLNIPDESLYVHNDRQNKKHALSAVYFPMQQVQKAGVVLAVTPARKEKCFQHNIRLEKYHCKKKNRKEKGGKMSFSMTDA